MTVEELLNTDTRIVRAFKHACQSHAEQKYGEYPYIKHLNDVAQVLFEFLHLVDPGEFEQLLCAVWLHDIVEDCGVELAEIRDTFGADIEQLVWAVTNPAGADAQLRYYLLGLRLETAPLAEMLKLADRIANVRSGALNKKYTKEQPLFELHCKSEDSRFLDMWNTLTEELHKWPL